MNVDFCGQPKPLEFGEGENAFKLHLKAIDSTDRMAIFDAVMENSMSAIQYAIERVVIGWENIFDTEGRPIPFEVQEEGGVKKNLARFLGCIPVADHMRVMVGILAFAGVPTGNVEQLVKALGTPAVDVDPTSRPGASTTKDASGG